MTPHALVPGRQVLLVGIGRFPRVADEGEPSLIAPAWPSLPFAHARIRDMERTFEGYRSGGFTITCLLDPDRDELSQGIKKIQNSNDDLCHIVHVISHGQPDPVQRDRLDVVPSCGRISGDTDIRRWIDEAQRAGTPSLFLVDLCRAGRVVNPQWLLEQTDDQVNAWVIAASWRHEDAFHGRFSEIAAETLGQCARDGLGTSPDHQFVPFSVLARSIADEMVLRYGRDQTVAWTKAQDHDRLTLPFLPNPRWRDDPLVAQVAALDQTLSAFLADVVADPEHFRTRAGRNFTGRREQLRALVPWLEGRGPHAGALRVVTGSPGSGKSALLGAIVCSVHPELIRLAPYIRDRLEHDVRPQATSRLAAVHARQRSLIEIIESIATQLALDRPVNGWNPARLLEAIGRMPIPPVIVLDALDECPHATIVQAVLLVPMVTPRQDGRTICRLLVGLRPWSQFGQLLSLARSMDGVLDLDAVSASALYEDLRVYLHDLLSDSRAFSDDNGAALLPQLCREVSAELERHFRQGLEVDATQRWGQFLVAGRFANYVSRFTGLRIDPEAVHELARQVPRDLPAVLELELSTHDQPASLRAVLAAVAFAKGEGMPASIVSRIAATVRNGPDPQLAKNIIDDEAARFYLRFSIDTDGTSLMRLYHQGLADYLKAYPDGKPEWFSKRTDASLRVYKAILQTRMDADSRPRWEHAPPYILRHAIHHAIEAGATDSLLSDVEYLVHADPVSLVQELGSGDSTFSRLCAAIYRLCHRRLVDLDSPGRRTVLALNALRQSAPGLAQTFLGDASRTMSWIPLWATGSAIKQGLWHSLSGHESRVNGVACIMVDGRPLAVSVSSDRTVRLWDLTSGQPIGVPITGHTDSVTCVAAVKSVDGSLLAFTGSADHTVRIWNLATGAQLGDVIDHGTQPTSICLGAVLGRPVFITGDAQLNVRFWDPADDRLVGMFRYEKWRRSTAEVFGQEVELVRDPDTSGFTLHDTKTRRAVSSFIDFNAGLPVETVSKVDGAELRIFGHPIAVAAGLDGSVQVLDTVAALREYSSLSGHKALITDLAIVDDRAFTADATGQVISWEIAKGIRAQHRRPGEEHSYPSDAIVQFTRLSEPTIVSRGRLTHRSDVTAVRLMPERVQTAATPHVVLGRADGSVTIKHLRTGRETRVALEHASEITSITPVRFRERSGFVTTSADGVIEVWSLPDGDRVMPVLRVPAIPATATVSLVDGTFILAWSDTRGGIYTGSDSDQPTIQVWDRVNHLAFSDKGELVAAIGWDLAVFAPTADRLTSSNP